MSEAYQETSPEKIQHIRHAKLIINPEAGQNTTESDVIHEIMTLFQEHYIDVELTVITPERSIRLLAEEAVNEHVDIVIISGGDGSIHEVLPVLRDTSTTLGILPSGTMNNIAYSLGIPEDIREAAQLIAQGKPHAIDVGTVNGIPFLEVVSVGAEASFFPVAETFRHKGLLGALRALVAGIQLLLHLQTHPMQLEIDGKKRRIHAWQITICNTPVYGLRFSAAPHARVDDGHFDLAIALYAHRWDLLQHYGSIMTGQRDPNVRTQMRRAKHVHIESHDPLPVAIDGDTYSKTPITIDIHPHSFKVFTGDISPVTEHHTKPDPFTAVLRSIMDHDDNHHDSRHVPAETAVKRMRQLSIWAWIATPIVILSGSILRYKRIWPFHPLPKEAQPIFQPRANSTLWGQITSLTLAAVFLRMRFVIEVLAYLLSGLITPITSRIMQLLPRSKRTILPDEGTMEAMTGMGIFLAGWWASRRSSLRRNTTLASFAMIGTLLARWGHHHQQGDADEQRDSIALGAAAGLGWLTIALSAITVIRSRMANNHMEVTVSLDPLKRNTVVSSGPVTTASPIVPVAQMSALQRGDIILFGPDNTAGARMIEIATRSHYHHVAIYDGDGMLIEAMPKGVRRFALGNRRVTGIRPNAHESQRRASADWARQHIGGSYDQRGLFLIGIDRIFPDLRLGSPGANRYSCAVFVADMYLHASVDLLPDKRWQDMIPGDFIDLIDMFPIQE